jgi:hypothetical protein
MSSNLILNDGIFEKTINKKTWKKKEKKMGLKSYRKKPNEDEIKKKCIANKKNCN